MSPDQTMPAKITTPAAAPPSAAATPAEGAAEGGSIAGYFRITGSRLIGWAWDSRRPEVALEVEIRKDARTIARMAADRFRPDLKDNGVGTGAYGFACDLAEPLPPEGAKDVAVVAFAPDDSREVPLINRSSVAPGAPAAAVQAVEAASAQAASALAMVAARLVPVIRQTTTETIQTSMQTFLDTVTPPVRQATDMVARLEAMQQDVATQLQALEVVQSRIDTLLGEMEGRLAARVGAVRQGERGLRIVVALVALVSLTSLAAGIWSMWNG